MFLTYKKKVVSKICPRVLIVAETELWPSFLSVASGLGVRLVSVNARVSNFTFKRYLALKFITKPLLSLFSVIFAQSSIDLERLISLGSDANKSTYLGNIKFDRELRRLSERERVKKKEELGFEESSAVFVAGSVRLGEEDIVINGFLRAKRTVSNLSMVFAPRQVEYFEEMCSRLSALGISYSRRTSQSTSGYSICVLDTVGELNDVYQVADASFVGGSLVDVGGHNPMEPAAFGVPVSMGPYVANVRTAVEELSATGGFFFIRDEKQLAEAIVDSVKLSPEVKREITQVVKSHKGATDRVLKKLATVDEIFVALVESKQSRSALEAKGGLN